MSYHLATIPKGKFGEFSKIREEFAETEDALDQQNPLMVLQELSDMIGAIEAYVAKYNITLDDLIKMKNATKRAFESGHRKADVPKHDNHLWVPAAGLKRDVPTVEEENVLKVTVTGKVGGGKSSLLGLIRRVLEEEHIACGYEDDGERRIEDSRVRKPQDRLRACNPTVVVLIQG